MGEFRFFGLEKLFVRRKFFKKNGDFDNALFVQLLYKARNAQKTKKNMLFSGDAFDIEMLIGGISKKEVWQFIHKLGNFLQSGLDIKSSFSILQRQMKNKRFQNIIKEMRRNLEHGLAVSDTLKQHKSYFDDLTISLVEVGEKTGTLPRVLQELDVRLLEQIELKSKIKGALIYPAVLVCLTVAMVAFMLIFVIPKITSAFASTGTELPQLTQIVIASSTFLTTYWLVILLSLIGLSFFLTFFGKTYTGRKVYSKIMLHIPVFGYIERQGNIILFINSFSLLLESGVLILEALEVAANVVNNFYYKRDIIRIKNEVETGMKLSQAMGFVQIGEKEVVFSNEYFPEDFVQMVNVGEETGTISKTIQQVGKTYNTELKNYIGNLMTLLEPFIIVFVGGLVGAIVIAIMLPFLNLVNVAKKL